MWSQLLVVWCAFIYWQFGKLSAFLSSRFPSCCNEVLRPNFGNDTVVLVTIPETGTVADFFFRAAEASIAILRKRDSAEMAETTLAVCSPTRSEPEGDTMQVEEEVTEPGGKRQKRDDVAKEMLASCAEDAANKATKEMASLMMKDAKEREQRLFEERDRSMMDHLGTAVTGISDSLE